MPPSARSCPVRFATAILPVLFMLAAGLAGCEKPVPTTYDPVPNQVVRETFASLFQDPPPQVMRQLHRLKDCMPEQSFPAMALRQEELRQVFGQLNARLQRGDLAGARQLIALAQKRLTPLPELVRTWDEAAHHLELARRRGEEWVRRERLFVPPPEISFFIFTSAPVPSSTRLPLVPMRTGLSKAGAAWMVSVPCSMVVLPL